jgi:hypothetical protein
MFQYNLPFGFGFVMEKTKKKKNVIHKVTLMNYNFFSFDGFQNSQLEIKNLKQFM